jgi:hypothetical protein
LFEVLNFSSSGSALREFDIDAVLLVKMIQFDPLSTV